MIIKKLRYWLNSYNYRNRFCTMERAPFYEIASKYLPSDDNSVILDIGSGQGRFARSVNTLKEYERIYLLDANPESIVELEKNFDNVTLYKAPERLPFDNRSVSFIHCSHLIEHLYHNELYNFLKEVDRVLTPKGVLVISAPTLWERFYDDLSHVKPYNPETVISYFCGGEKDRSAKPISERYTILELVCRYYTKGVGEGWGSGVALFDFVIQCTKKLLCLIGIKNYIKNGYVIVLKKTN